MSIPLGVTASAHADVATPGLHYVGTVSTSTGTTTRTFSGVNLGGSGAYARTVLVVGWRHNVGAPTVSSLTVGGSAATERVEAAHGLASGESVHDIATPSATADIVISMGVSVIDLRVAVYLLLGSASLPAYITGGSEVTITAAPGRSVALTLPSGGGYVVAGSYNEDSPASMTTTWSGGVTADDSTYDTAYFHPSFASGDVSSTSPTITATWSDTGHGSLAVAAYTRG